MSSDANKKVIWVLGGALAIALAVIFVGVGYLLGHRADSPGPAAPAVVYVTNPAPTPSPTPPSPEPSEPAPEGVPPAPTPVPDVSAPTIVRGPSGRVLVTNQPQLPTKLTSAPAQGTLGQTTPSSDADMRARVAEYFAQMSRLQAGPTGVSTNDFAQQLLSGAMQGDTSGLQNLKRDLERLHSEAAALVPPEPCREYHTKNLALLSETRELYDQLIDSISTGNMGALVTLSSRASPLESRGRQLEALERTLKAQYEVR